LAASRSRIAAANKTARGQSARRAGKVALVSVVITRPDRVMQHAAAVEFRTRKLWDTGLSGQAGDDSLARCRRLTASSQVICPTGFRREILSSLDRKKIPRRSGPKSLLYP
jgi:hypothetical protein